MSDYPDTTHPIPRQDLLIKLMGMTGSDNDNEALAALRKANALLKSADWSWERLINGKIRVIADPFQGLAQPGFAAAAHNAGASPFHGSTPSRPRPTTPPPPPPPRKPQTWPLGINPNRFASFCYCCGNEVVAGAGLIFKPADHNVRATSDWRVACVPCNSTAHVAPYAAARAKKKRGTHSVNDLS